MKKKLTVSTTCRRYTYILGSRTMYADYCYGRRTEKNHIRQMLQDLFVTGLTTVPCWYSWRHTNEPKYATAERLSTGGIKVGCHYFSRAAVRRMMEWAGVKR